MTQMFFHAVVTVYFSNIIVLLVKYIIIIMIPCFFHLCLSLVPPTTVPDAHSVLLVVGPTATSNS